MEKHPSKTDTKKKISFNINPQRKPISGNHLVQKGFFLPTKSTTEVKRIKTMEIGRPKEILRGMTENKFQRKSEDEDSLSEISNDEIQPDEVEIANKKMNLKHNPFKRMGTLKKSKDEDEDKKDQESKLDRQLEILQNLINEYYMEIYQNYNSNWEDYVVNNLAIIAYLEKILPDDLISEKTLSEEALKSSTKLDKKKKILFVDLDETLIHSDLEQKYENYDVQIEIQVDDSSSAFNLLIRPYCKEFLEYAHKQFNVVLYTAGLKDYADQVISQIDPEDQYFAVKLYREDCICFNDFFIKNMEIFKGFSLKDVIILDNCIFSFALHISNGILISSFYADKEDDDLLKVIEYLEKSILPVPDARLSNENLYGLTDIKNALYEKLKNENVIDI